MLQSGPNRSTPRPTGQSLEQHPCRAHEAGQRRYGFAFGKRTLVGHLRDKALILLTMNIKQKLCLFTHGVIIKYLHYLGTVYSIALTKDCQCIRLSKLHAAFVAAVIWKSLNGRLQTASWSAYIAELARNIGTSNSALHRDVRTCTGRSSLPPIDDRS